MKYITIGNDSINPDLVIHFHYKEPQAAPVERQQDETLKQDARASILTVVFVGNSEKDFYGDDADSIKAALLAL
jgi:hypothetical protein